MRSDVFILGAGFSKAISQVMPVLKELSTDVADSITHAWESSWGSDLRSNVELLLSHLASRHPWKDEANFHFDMGKFVEIRDVLVDRIRRAEVEAASTSEPPEWLSLLIRVWHRMRTTVVTFNYDTLIERVFSQTIREGPDENSGAFASHDALYPVPVTNAKLRSAGIFGARRPDTFELLKLHGSSSWWYSGPDAPPGDVVYDTPSRGWGNNTSLDAEPPRDVRDKQPLIVPPLLQKSPFYENTLLRAQWQRARTALEGADRIICIGYSLPLTDLTSRLLLSTSSSGVEVVLVDRYASDRLVKHYREALPGFNVYAEASGEDAVATFVRKLAEEDEPERVD